MLTNEILHTLAVHPRKVNRALALDESHLCEGCGENIPTPVETMRDSWIVAECPLCESKRRYLPTEIFRGTLSHLLTIGSASRRPDRG